MSRDWDSKAMNDLPKIGAQMKKKHNTFCS